MDLSFLNSFIVPVIIGICLCVGYIIKQWIQDVDNKYIPTICAIIGTGVAISMNWGNISPEILLQGLASGLAATGLHQAFSQFLENK